MATLAFPIFLFPTFLASASGFPAAAAAKSNVQDRKWNPKTLHKYLYTWFIKHCKGFVRSTYPLFFAAASPTPLTIPITKHAIAPGQQKYLCSGGLKPTP